MISDEAVVLGQQSKKVSHDARTETPLGKFDLQMTLEALTWCGAVLTLSGSVDKLSLAAALLALFLCPERVFGIQKSCRTVHGAGLILIEHRSHCLFK